MDNLDLLEVWLKKFRNKEKLETYDDLITDLYKIAGDLEMLRYIKPLISSVVAKDDPDCFIGYLVPHTEFTYKNARVFNQIETWLARPVALSEELKYQPIGNEEEMEKPQEILDRLYYLAYCNSKAYSYGANKIRNYYEILSKYIRSQNEKEKYKNEKFNDSIYKVLPLRACNILVRWVYRLKKDGIFDWVKEINSDNIVIGDVIKYQLKFRGAWNMGKKTWECVRETINNYVGEEVI